MAKFTTKEFRYALFSDKKFIEKLRQAQSDFSEGRVGFYVSTQILIGYVSYKILSSFYINDRALLERFRKMNNYTGDINALEALRLLCTVINRQDLLADVEASGVNDYANVDKHGKLYIPFDYEVAEPVVMAYNNLINEVSKITRFVDNNCLLKVVKNDSTIVEEVVEEKEEPKPVKKEKTLEEKLKNETYMAETTFLLGNSEWSLKIIDCYRDKKKDTFNTVTYADSVTFRLTLLEANEGEDEKRHKIGATLCGVVRVLFGKDEYNYGVEEGHYFKDEGSTRKIKLYNWHRLESPSNDFLIIIDNCNIDEEVYFYFNIKNHKLTFKKRR